MIVRLMLALYPHRWRQRYGEELLALAEERALSAADVVDLARGAVDAHLFWRGAEQRSSHRSLCGRTNGWTRWLTAGSILYGAMAAVSFATLEAAAALAVVLAAAGVILTAGYAVAGILVIKALRVAAAQLAASNGGAVRGRG